MTLSIIRESGDNKIFRTIRMHYYDIHFTSPAPLYGVVRGKSEHSYHN